MLLFLRRIPDRLLQYMSLVALPPISHAGFTLIFTAVLKRCVCAEAFRAPQKVAMQHGCKNCCPALGIGLALS